MVSVAKIVLSKRISGIAIALGGAFGALLRYIICSIISNNILAIFICNIIGSFVISLAIEYRRNVNRKIGDMISVGFCGGVSVFASFSHDSVKALNEGNFSLFFGNLFANFAICVLVAFLAKIIVENLHNYRNKLRKARRWRNKS
ncbi:MAG: CrcB family protein [Verrucomicrobiaceae bacterium]|nr:CrcB family protein [Verrucomicrobiaceae bacterium]